MQTCHRKQLHVEDDVETARTLPIFYSDLSATLPIISQAPGSIEYERKSPHGFPRGGPPFSLKARIWNSPAKISLIVPALSGLRSVFATCPVRSSGGFVRVVVYIYDSRIVFIPPIKLEIVIGTQYPDSNQTLEPKFLDLA